MPASKKHVHKYRYVIISPTKGMSLWSCALPKCSHFMPKHLEYLLVGKMTLCWGCNEETYLTSENMCIQDDFDSNELHPLCPNCLAKKNGSIPLDSISDLLSKLE